MGVNLKNPYGQTGRRRGHRPARIFFRHRSVGRKPHPGDDQDCAGPGNHGRHTRRFRWVLEDEATTSETLTGSLIKTGDVGEFDERGDLRIVDRKKDIVITAGGKNVSPSRGETAPSPAPASARRASSARDESI